MSTPDTPDAQTIVDNIDELFFTMKPRWCNGVSMDGKYPCWIVWLPKHGTCYRKSLKAAIVECAEQLRATGDL